MGQSSSQPVEGVYETPQVSIPEQLQSPTHSVKKRKKKSKAQSSDEASRLPVPDANLQSTADTTVEKTEKKKKKKKKKSHTSPAESPSSPAATNTHVDSFAHLTQSSSSREGIPKADIQADTGTKKKKQKNKKSYTSPDHGLSSPTAPNAHVESSALLIQSSPSREEIPKANQQAHTDTKKKNKKKKEQETSHASRDESLLPPPATNGHVESSAYPTQLSPSREVAPVSSKRKREPETEPEHKKKKRHSTAESAHATEPERKKKKKKKEKKNKRHSTREWLSTNSALNEEINGGHTLSESLNEPKPKKNKKGKVIEQLQPASPTNDAFSAAWELEHPPAPSPDPRQSKKSKKSKKPRKQNDEEPVSSKPPHVLHQSPVSSAAQHSTPQPSSEKKPRKGRPGEKNNQKIGHFTADEIRKAKEFKNKFCADYGILKLQFDEMVQHSERSDDKADFPSIITKSEFWSEIYKLLPDRNRRSVYRFMRRHFQDTTQKAYEWTPAQDKELIDLHAEHGPKWVQIAKILGRSDDDVTQRWKNRLEHRSSMNHGLWMENEIRALLDALQENWNVLHTTNPQAAGKDIYEMDETAISWGAVSNMMNNIRSRQQVADKWRKIRRKVDLLRANGQPDAVCDPEEEVKECKRWGEKRKSKSSYYVVDDGSDDEDKISPESTGMGEQQGMALASAQMEEETEPRSSPRSQSDLEVPPEAESEVEYEMESEDE